MSLVEEVSTYLKKIDKKNPDLNAFLEVFEQESMQQAKDLSEKEGLGKLSGWVVAIKDVLCYKDHQLTCGSKILEGFQSQFSATAVERLVKEEAVIIGRVNCDEFAMGSSNENSAYGVVHNEVDLSRVPGGSSGGSAVAVQADLCRVSLGTDTGGSVRQPAAFCGVIGFKPTYGRISRYGLAAYASSFDCVGILGKEIEDIAKVLEVTAGEDDFDSTCSQKEVPVYSKHLSFERKTKVAYFKEALNPKGLQPEIYENTLASIEALKKDGHMVEAVDFPLLDYILPTYYILTTAEASSNLARYDGVRYGFRSKSAMLDETKALEQMYKQTRTQGFGKEVKRRIVLGTFVLSANYYDAYYTKAQKIRRLVKDATDALFKEYEFILSPTTPTTAFKIGEKQEDILQMYLADLYTVQANVVGIPAISIPNGVDKSGLPIGLQLMAKSFEEQNLLAFAQHILKK